MTRRMSHWIMCLFMILGVMVGMTLTASAETKELNKDTVYYEGDTITWEGSKYVKLSDTETKELAGGFEIKCFNDYDKESNQWEIRCYPGTGIISIYLAPQNGETGMPEGIKWTGGAGTEADPLVWELYYPEQTKKIQYRKATVDSENRVTYADQETGSYSVVTENMPSYWPSGCYVVNSSYVSLSSKAIICGEVDLILCDDCTLNVSDGIIVSEGNILNIYAQSKGTGKLETKGINGSGDPYSSANSGDVTIHGGTVTATGGRYSTGIGGVKGDKTGGNGGNVMIYGGTVTATGGDFGAGIGGGGSVEGTGGNGGTVTIYGGTVTATGGIEAAGIGGGTAATGGNGGNVMIYGGTVTATGGDGAAGIGRANDAASNGTLSVGTGLVVYGGKSAEDAQEIQKNDGDYGRKKYMQVVIGYPLWVGGTQVNALNSGDVLKDGTVTYVPDATDSTKGTLTLKGAKITDKHSTGTAAYNVFSEGIDLTIVLVGDNFVGGTDGLAEFAIGVYKDIPSNSFGNLTIRGSGTVTVKSNDCAVLADSGIELVGLEITEPSGAQKKTLQNGSLIIADGEGNQAKEVVIEPVKEPEPAVKNGDVFKISKNTYTITSVAKGTVKFKKARNAKKVTVPKTVTYKGRKYTVTGISAKAFKGKKTKTLVVKTKKLTKKSVKGSLKGSKVKTVKVKVGKKSVNKKYVKKYKKIFTKKNAGKKAVVKR